MTFKKINRRYKVTVTAFRVLAFILFSLVLISVIALYGFFKTSSDLSSISNKSIPKIITGTQFTDYAKSLVFEVERLSSSESETHLRISSSSIDKLLIQIRSLIELEGMENQQIKGSINVMEKTLVELERLVASRIQITSQIDKKQTNLFKLPGKIFNFEKGETGISNNNILSELISEWSTIAQETIILAGQARSEHSLYKIRNISKLLSHNFQTLSDLSINMPQSLKRREKKLETLLYEEILGASGILPMLIEQQKLLSKSTARANLSRSVVRDFETLTINIFNSEINTTKEKSSSLSFWINRLVLIFSFLVGISILITLILVSSFNRNISIRLVNLNKAVMKNDIEDAKSIIHERNDEISDLSESFLYFIEEVEKRETELKRLATTDSLTSINNRRFFMELANKEMIRIKRSKEPLVILMLDLDNFKDINDSYGHSAGDIVLREFSGLGLKCLRDADIFGRIGGEEFAVLLPQTKIEDGLVVAERLRTGLENNVFKYKNNKIRCTTSIGISKSSGDKISLTDLLQMADEALYKAKKTGRNRICISGKTC